MSIVIHRARNARNRYSESGYTRSASFWSHAKKMQPQTNNLQCQEEEYHNNCITNILRLNPLISEFQEQSVEQLLNF